ncbi:unnamed protein product [marine sediment metagenome]|uniref:Uncharacterized protein n=1 Tax=marine sediment metagenome TaxID=412755 RepID=X1FJ19_9ZZZZ
MGNYGKLVGMTYQMCYRCKDKNQKTVYLRSGQRIARCRNCGSSWKTNSLTKKRW